MMKKVVVMGSVTLDILVKSKALKATKSHEVVGGVALCEVLGGKINAEEIKMMSGGGASNVTYGLKKLGLWPRILGSVGDDAVGVWVKGELEGEGIDLFGLQNNSGETAKSVVLVAEDGGRSILTHKGDGSLLNEKKIDWISLKTADWCQITGSLGSIQLLEDAVIWFSKKGVELGLNPGKSELAERERLIKLLPKISFLSLNRMEAVHFWGERFEEIDSKLLAKKFLECGVKMVAITDGKRGAGLAVDGEWVKAGVYETNSIDDTGAGDAFVSGVVSGILQGADLGSMLKRGLANGASVVTCLGAKDGLLDIQKMEDWMKKELILIEEKI